MEIIENNQDTPQNNAANKARVSASYASTQHNQDLSQAEKYARSVTAARQAEVDEYKEDRERFGAIFKQANDAAAARVAQDLKSDPIIKVVRDDFEILVWFKSGMCVSRSENVMDLQLPQDQIKPIGERNLVIDRRAYEEAWKRREDLDVNPDDLAYFDHEFCITKTGEVLNTQTGKSDNFFGEHLKRFAGVLSIAEHKRNFEAEQERILEESQARVAELRERLNERIPVLEASKILLEGRRTPESVKAHADMCVLITSWLGQLRRLEESIIKLGGEVEARPEVLQHLADLGVGVN